jgi:hypothetical protein
MVSYVRIASLPSFFGRGAARLAVITYSVIAYAASSSFLSYAILLLFLVVISTNARPPECCHGSCKCRPALHHGILSDVITKILCGQEQQTTRPADRATMLDESATTVALWAVRVCAHMVHHLRSTHQLSRPSLTVGRMVFRAFTDSTTFLLLWKEKNFGQPRRRTADGLPRCLILLQMRSNQDQQPIWSGTPR